MPILESRGSGSAFGFGFSSNTLPDLPVSLKTANLIGWYDAADLSTMVFTNGKVSTWRNKRNPGTRDLTQATEANMPTVFQGAFGARPALLFGGGDQNILRHTGNTGLSTGFTVAVVAKKHTNPMNGYYPRVVSFSPNQTGGSPGNFDYDSTGGMIISGFPSNNGLGSWHNSINKGTNIDWNSQVLAVARHSNSLGYGNFLINNTSITTDIGLTEAGANRTFSMSSFVGGMTVGGNNHGGGENFAGFVGEIIIWDTYLSDADLTTLASYVNNKWKNPPAFRTTSLPNYIAGSAYSQQLNVFSLTGGSITYSLSSGQLPTGLSLSSSGLISGTVTAGTTSTFSFTVKATDSDGDFSFFSYSVDTPIYAFSSHTFTSAGATGRQGPSLSAARSSYSSASWAQNSAYFDVTATGIQRWTVPETGVYTITATGAGGSGSNNYGGYGAIARDNFSLTKGEIINILVGQRGNGGTGANTGNGGTFVVKSPYTQTANVLVAAGGGGATESGVADRASANANTSSNGKDGSNEGATINVDGHGSGGTGGNGGNTASNSNGGGGGGGFLTNGARNNNWNNNGGDSFVNGGLGASAGSTGYQGGFGGGGGGGGNGDGGGAGGGGGYSGGGGGDNVGDSAGGGGGSITQGLGSNVSITVASSFGAGSVAITKVA